MEKLTGLLQPPITSPTDPLVGQRIFRSTFYELTESCYRFTTREFSILLAGNLKQAMLARIPSFDRQLGAGYVVARINDQSQAFQDSLQSYVKLLNMHETTATQLKTPAMKVNPERGIPMRLKLAQRGLECYRTMRQVLIAALPHKDD